MKSLVSLRIMILDPYGIKNLSIKKMYKTYTTNYYDVATPLGAWWSFTDSTSFSSAAFESTLIPSKLLHRWQVIITAISGVVFSNSSREWSSWASNIRPTQNGLVAIGHPAASLFPENELLHLYYLSFDGVHHVRYCSPSFSFDGVWGLQKVVVSRVKGKSGEILLFSLPRLQFCAIGFFHINCYPSNSLFDYTYAS